MLRFLECNKNKHLTLSVRTPRLASRAHRTGPATEQTETQSTKHRAQNRGPIEGGRSVERTVRAKARDYPTSPASLASLSQLVKVQRSVASSADSAGSRKAEVLAGGRRLAPGSPGWRQRHSACFPPRPSSWRPALVPPRAGRVTSLLDECGLTFGMQFLDSTRGALSRSKNTNASPEGPFPMAFLASLSHLPPFLFSAMVYWVPTWRLFGTQEDWSTMPPWAPEQSYEHARRCP